MNAAHSRHVLSLYRQLLRGMKTYPSSNREGMKRAIQLGKCNIGNSAICLNLKMHLTN
jgi:hypothetical protein